MEKRKAGNPLGSIRVDPSKKKVKISISLGKDLLKEIDLKSKQAGLNRSEFIVNAVNEKMGV